MAAIALVPPGQTEEQQKGRRVMVRSMRRYKVKVITMYKKYEISPLLLKLKINKFNIRYISF